MEIRIQRHPLHQLPPVGLERAAVVPNRDAGHPPDDPVGHHGWQLAPEPGILTALPIACHQIEAFFEFGKQPGNVGGIVLEIAVHAHHDGAARVVEPRLQRRGLAVIAGQRDQPDSGIPNGAFPNPRWREVGAAVIDEQHFPGRAPLERLLDGLHQREDVSLFVEHRHDHGDRDRHLASPSPAHRVLLRAL